jgi:hypothetical protein
MATCCYRCILDRAGENTLGLTKHPPSRHAFARYGKARVWLHVNPDVPTRRHLWQHVASSSHVRLLAKTR